MTIGGALAAAAGPVGVGGAVNTSLLKPAPMFTYSKSKGLFAGVSLEGTVLIERVSRPSTSRGLLLTIRDEQKDANEAFYGQPLAAVDLLAGKVPPPEAASALYETIEAAETVDESGLPDAAYVVPDGAVGTQVPLSTNNNKLFEAGPTH